MTDWTQDTGGTGTMMIRDTGTYVEFWLNSGNPNSASPNLPWKYIINNVDSGWKYFNYVANSGWQRFGRWNITNTQTVTFAIGNSGTTGIGGPTTFSHTVIRFGNPSAPTFLYTIGPGAMDCEVHYKDGYDNLAAIDARQIGIATFNTKASITDYYEGVGSASNWSVAFGLLEPGQTYYVWGRTHNSQGWGDWSTVTTFTMHSLAWIKWAGEWKNAKPYVRSGGQWFLARPWVKYGGTWQEID